MYGSSFVLVREGYVCISRWTLCLGFVIYADLAFMTPRHVKALKSIIYFLGSFLTVKNKTDHRAFYNEDMCI